MITGSNSRLILETVTRKLLQYYHHTVSYIELFFIVYIYSDIPIPLYEPACCNSCFSVSSIRLSYGPTKVAVFLFV
jgi:hypothetical protein